MSDEPSRVGSRLLDLCLAVLLGAMALYGAVAILEAIWVYLCILAAVLAIVGLLWWLFHTRYRGW
jgi:hypothetical protein